MNKVEDKKKNIKKIYPLKSRPQSKRRKKAKPAIVRQTHTIDAAEKILGRLACEIVPLLRGKNKPDFQYHLDQGDIVIVTNAGKIKISGKKLKQKIYYHYSGYPGGLKKVKMDEVFDKNPAEVLKRTVWNMLPKNKLRPNMMKRLKITN